MIKGADEWMYECEYVCMMNMNICVYMNDWMENPVIHTLWDYFSWLNGYGCKDGDLDGERNRGEWDWE